MANFLRAVGSLVRPDDVDQFLQSYLDGGANWSPADLREAALNAGMTIRRARTIIVASLNERFCEAQTPDDWRAFLEEQAWAVDQLGITVQVHERDREDSARRLLAQAYGRQVDERTVDRDALVETGRTLGFGEMQTQSLVEELARSIVVEEIERMLDDGLISPDEDVGLADLVERLGVGSVSLDAAGEVEMDQARQLWRVRHGQLTPIASPLLLKKGESAFLACAAEAAERRERTVRINFAGPTARIRIMKGVYYSVGSRSISTEREQYEHSFGVGTMVLTDRRLLWAGPNRNFGWKYEAFIDLRLWNDAFEISRDVGKPVRFYFDRNPSVSALLSRLASA